MTVSADPPQELPHPHRSRLAATLRALFRARVTAGLLVVLLPRSMFSISNLEKRSEKHVED